jgi:hypothetical protein
MKVLPLPGHAASSPSACCVKIDQHAVECLYAALVEAKLATIIRRARQSRQAPLPVQHLFGHPGDVVGEELYLPGLVSS